MRRKPIAKEKRTVIITTTIAGRVRTGPLLASYTPKRLGLIVETWLRDDFSRVEPATMEIETADSAAL